MVFFVPKVLGRQMLARCRKLEDGEMDRCNDSMLKVNND
jgi:hypothetical protein